MFRRKKDYKISLDSEEWVAPEETLIDVRSQHSHMEMPISELIFKLFLIAFLSLFILIMVLVFRLSVIENNYFTSLALQNKSSNFPISPPRGIIFDRLGQPIAKNTPNFDLLVVSNRLQDTAQGDNDPSRLDIFDGTGQISSVASILGKDTSSFFSRHKAIFLIY